MWRKFCRDYFFFLAEQIFCFVMTGFCLHFPWFQNSGSVAGIQNWRSSAKFLVSASWCLLQRASFGTALPFFPAVKQQAQLLSILKLSWKLWLTIDSKTTFTFPPLFRLLRTCTTYASLSFWLFLLLLGVRSIKKVLKKKKRRLLTTKKILLQVTDFQLNTQTQTAMGIGLLSFLGTAPSGLAERKRHFNRESGPSSSLVMPLCGSMSAWSRACCCRSPVSKWGLRVSCQIHFLSQPQVGSECR